MKQKSLFILFTVLLSAFLFLFTAFLGSFSFILKEILGTALYFGVVLFLSVKFPYQKSTILLVLLLPLFLILFFVNILDFQISRTSIPGNIFFVLGCLAGFYFAKTKKWLILFSLFVLLCCWELSGNKLLSNKMNFGTYSQRVFTPIPRVQLVDSNATPLQIADNNKIIILDFWNSGCGVCFRLFPFVDSINKQIDRNKFEIRLVNIPMNGQKKKDNFRILNRFPYSIDQVFAENISVADSFGVVAYPTTIVIKNNNILFRGDFENAIAKLKDF